MYLSLRVLLINLGMSLAAINDSNELDVIPDRPTYSGHYNPEG